MGTALLSGPQRDRFSGAQPQALRVLWPLTGAEALLDDAALVDERLAGLGVDVQAEGQSGARGGEALGAGQALCKLS